MRLGIPAERRLGETRVAATPETIKKLVANKHQVVVQSGAGTQSSIPDEAYMAAGAQIGTTADAFNCDAVLKVRAPSADERALMKTGTVVIGMLNPFDVDNIAVMASHGLTAFALEAAPRTTLRLARARAFGSGSSPITSTCG